MAMDYLRPAEGGVLVDASCGTGLFTRLFARSRKFRGVVALDFSESMLQQAQQFFSEDPALATRWGADSCMGGTFSNMAHHVAVEGQAGQLKQ